MIKNLKNRVFDFAEQNEHWMTLILVVIALILLLVAIFGTSRHKALACLYIVL